MVYNCQKIASRTNKNETTVCLLLPRPRKAYEFGFQFIKQVDFISFLQQHLKDLYLKLNLFGDRVKSKRIHNPPKKFFKLKLLVLIYGFIIQVFILSFCVGNIFFLFQLHYFVGDKHEFTIVFFSKCNIFSHNSCCFFVSSKFDFCVFSLDFMSLCIAAKDFVLQLWLFISIESLFCDK